MYTPEEISTIADKFKELVAERKIGFELDGFGNPVQKYFFDAKDVLAEAIKCLPSFPRKCVVENAMLEASTDWHEEIFEAATCEEVPSLYLMEQVFADIKRSIHEAAFLDISDKLFTTKQIQAMLRQHPDYLKVRDADIRAGKLYADEMEDIARPRTGILSADEFNKTFSEVA